MRQDGGAASHCRKWNVAEGLLSTKELCHYDSVNPLGCGSGHCRYGGLRIQTEGLLQVIVLETSSWTDNATFLKLVELLLAGLQMADHFHEGLVLLVYYSELLVQRVLHCILLRKGLVIEDGDGVADSALYRL